MRRVLLCVALLSVADAPAMADEIAYLEKMDFGALAAF
jgi:hypothetical protein